MSEIPTQVPSGTGDQQNQGTEPQGGGFNEPTNDPQGQQQGSEHSLANPFLQNIPEEHREIVGQYVKQWDGGVTRRFQELHNTYKQQLEPYQQLGQIEELQRARQLYDVLRTNPVQVYQLLQQRFGSQQQPQPQQQQQGFGQEELPDDLAPVLQKYDSRFDEFKQQFDQQNQVLSALSQFVLQAHEAQKNAEEQKALDTYLSALKDEFGDYDEQYVLTLMAAGKTGEEAVKAYKQAVQAQLNQERAPAVGSPVLSGAGGAPPSQQKSVTELDSNEVKNLVAQTLAMSLKPQ